MHTEGNADTVPLDEVLPQASESDVDAGNDRHTYCHCRCNQDGQSHTNASERTST